MLDIRKVAGAFCYRSQPGQQPSDLRMNEIISDIARLLDKGWSLEDLYARIQHLNHVDITQKPSHIFKNPPTQPQPVVYQKDYSDPNNLLKQGEYYYHSELRESKKPIYAKINIKGELIYSNPDIAIQLKEKYYMQDLLGYFYMRCNIKPEPQLYAKHAGAFNHLLKSNSLDELLFTIDVVSDVAIHGHLAIDSPFDLQTLSAFEEGRNRRAQAKAYFEGVKVNEYLRY